MIVFISIYYDLTEDSFSITAAAKEEKNNKSDGKYSSKSLTYRLPKRPKRRICLLHLRKLSHYTYRVLQSLSSNLQTKLIMKCLSVRSQ